MKFLVYFCSILLVAVFASGHSDSVDTCLVDSPSDDAASSIIRNVYTSVKEGECRLGNPSDLPPHYELTDEEEFDFIVVGAGSAGAVVANRLSEVKSWNVLLIEAGGDPTKTVEVPGMFGSLQLTEVDWQYKTEPSEYNCHGMKNNTCNWPRGKVLGGSSSINVMLYVRGIPQDYNRWAELGNTGWDYESVLPYFKKSEDIRAEEVLQQNDFEEYHSKGGYLSVDTWGDTGVTSIADGYSKGMGELGYKSNAEYNGKDHLGFTRLQGTHDKGIRASTAHAFLKPIKARGNLKVAKKSYATRLLIDKETKTVQGVELLKEDGKVIKVRAKKEVIVSGGAINSPQLLMLSGIGPREHLEALDIEVVQDLPVGESLFDHVLMIGWVFAHKNFSREVKPTNEQMLEYLTSNSGDLASISMASYGLFINTIDKQVNAPDIQFHHFNVDAGDFDHLQAIMNIMNIKDEIAEQYHKINSNSYITMTMGTLLQPKSSGKIQLRSKDPLEHPKITTGVLSEDEDIETYLRAAEFAETLANSEALKKFDTEFHEIAPPDCQVHPVSSRDFRVCALRHMVATTYHPTTTCKMGPAGEPSSVVDPQLRVIGVHGLRVVDASIMPYIVSGNTNAAVIMIGEKASDIIKQAWAPDTPRQQ